MTVLALILGAVAAGAGTRIAAVALIAAAAIGALDGGLLGAVVTWSAALGAGCVMLLQRSVRPLGLPILGMAAVLSAGLADNGALVGGLWVIGTAAAVLAAVGTDLRDLGSRPQAVRWAVRLCLTDLLVMAAIASASPEGFEGWPATLEGAGAALLLASSILRTMLAAGPPSPGTTDVGHPAGLLVVRTQTLVGVALAIVAAGPGPARVAVIAGAAGFAAAPFARRAQLTDVAAEVAAFALAAGATALGWVPSGWAWGALAAGTLIHHLRLMVGRRTAGRWADATLRSPGIGLPFLPVVAAVLGGAMVARGWTLVAVGLGSLLGLGARCLRPGPPTPRRTRTSGVLAAVEDVRGTVVVSLAFVAALWAGAMTLPRAVAAQPLAWAPPWAIAVVLACAVAGSVIGGVVPARRRPSQVLAPLPGPVARAASASAALAGRVSRSVPDARPMLLTAAVAVLVLAAAAMWIVGLTRGFL